VTLEKTSAPTWILPNAEEAGYYRWSVPTPMLGSIADQAAKVLDARERVGFVYNLAALLDAGVIHGDEYLRLLTEFANDPQPEVITAVIAGFEKVRRTFVTPVLVAAHARLVRSTLRPTLTRYGMTPAKNEPAAVSLMRPGLLSVLGEHGMDNEVMTWAGTAARQYLQNPASVDPSVAGTALELAARRGDQALFDEYRTRFESTKLPAERARFLAALGKFRNPQQLEQALAYSVSGPLRPQERLTIPRNVAEDETLKARVWAWLKENRGQLVGRIPPDYVTRLTGFAECCDSTRIEEVQWYFAEANTPGTREELAKVFDSIRDCAALKAREEMAVMQALKQLARPATTSEARPQP
jgi:aminopeptidase N